MRATKRQRRTERGHQGGPEPRVVAVEYRPVPDAEARLRRRRCFDRLTPASLRWRGQGGPAVRKHPGPWRHPWPGDASRMLPLADPPRQVAGRSVSGRSKPCRERTPTASP